MPLLSRRTALRAGGLACLASLAGCSERDPFDAPIVDRLVFLSETGESERFRILKTHAPRDDSTVQSIAEYEAPASGRERLVELDEGPGFYNIHAEALDSGGIAFLAFNSHANGGTSNDLQFEFVVREDGNLSSNIGRKGDEISSYDPTR